MGGEPAELCLLLPAESHIFLSVRLAGPLDPGNKTMQDLILSEVSCARSPSQGAVPFVWVGTGGRKPLLGPPLMLLGVTAILCPQLRHRLQVKFPQADFTMRWSGKKP